MKKILLCFAVQLFLLACNNDNKTAGSVAVAEEDSVKPDFFPVTSYIKGQIAEMKTSGINPLKYVTVGNKKDSTWLKMEEFDAAFAEFTNPVIDSVNMVALFKEERFHDKTLNAYTFTAEPKGSLPAGMQLRRWDVYIDPQTDKVKRVYIQKNISDNKMLQLTWEANLGSKAVYISTDASGNNTIEKEEFIKWNFNEE